LRTRLDESGAKFGRRLEEDLGEPWSRQTVWEAENGMREFRAEELVALARAGNVTVDYFLTAPAKTKVQLKGGSTLTSSELIDLLRAPQPTKKTAGHIGAVLYILEKEVEGYIEDAMNCLQPAKERLKAIVEAEK
jgi:hypothetical protein